VISCDKCVHLWLLESAPRHCEQRASGHSHRKTPSANLCVLPMSRRSTCLSNQEIFSMYGLARGAHLPHAELGALQCSDHLVQSNFATEPRPRNATLPTLPSWAIQCVGNQPGPHARICLPHFNVEIESICLGLCSAKLSARPRLPSLQPRGGRLLRHF
jgi:hypothetical protein